MPDDPQISDLASTFRSVSVETPALQFGNLTPAEMENPSNLEAVVKLLHLHKKGLQDEIGAVDAEQRQELAELRHSLERQNIAFEELQQMLRAALPQLPKAPGPTDTEAVAQLLATKESRKQAVEDFGWKWALDVEDKGLLPLPAYRDRDFYNELMAQRKPSSGMPALPAPPAPVPSASADLLASANLPLSPPAVNKAASDALTALTTSSPFSAALASRNIKFELPKPSKFTRIAADSDIRAWLVRIHEYLTVTGVDPSVWVVFAGNFLDKSPLDLWESRKSQLASQPDVLYSWDNFKEWCIKSFSVHNHERHAISQLQNLTQTGSVAEYRAAHNSLAAKTNLPMQLRIHWWELGLKEHIRAQVKVDPETHQEYTDIDKAQSAACALDAHIDASSAAAASRKRTPPSTAAAVRSDSQRPSQRTKYSDYVEGAPVKVVTWSGNSPEEFHCNDLNGKLCDPLPDFFSSWISGLTGPAGNPDKKFLPQPLLTSGALKRGVCYYKGCAKPGHSWDHCPRLATHVAKNPQVRNA